MRPESLREPAGWGPDFVPGPPGAGRRAPTAASFRPFPYEALQSSIPAQFRRQVAERPDATAVWTPGRSLTYAELDRASSALAASLPAGADRTPEPVAILMEQSLEAVVAILGILRAGHFYVPLDAAHPPTRLAAMFAHARGRCVVTTQAHAAIAERLSDRNGSVVRADALKEASPAAGLEREISPDAPAYLYFTSGSTGAPKGVVDSHRNVQHNVLRYTNNLKIGPGDRLSLIQSPTFSGTVSSVFSALLSGATVCPFSFRDEGFRAMAEWMNEAGITVYHSVPSIFRGLMSGRRRFPTVRIVRLEGDQVLARDVECFRHGFAPPCRLAVGLGATETGLACQYFIEACGPPWEGLVPVGYATADTEVLILDDEGKDLGLMQAGEIAVRSPYLATGYWRQPDLTRAKFTPDPAEARLRTYRTGDRGRLRADRCLEFLGRMDGQPKVRGQRVELAEIEATLAGVVGIAQALVAIREDAPGDPQLVAYVVPSTTPPPTVAAIRRALAVTLPGAMVPTAFVFLEALPLSDQGKVDRRAPLPSPGPMPGPRGPKLEPRDEVEAAVAAVWESALEHPDLGMADDFFDLGGDSLRAATICARLKREWGWEVTPAELESHPTVERLAGVLRGSSGGEADTEDPIVTLQPRGHGTPYWFVHDHPGRLLPYAPLARQLGDAQPCYGLRARTEATPGKPVESLEALAALHLAQIRPVQSTGPYRLLGLCFGGVVAFEIARQLHESGADVEQLTLIGISPYDFPGLVSARARTLHRLCESRSELGSNLRYHALVLRELSAVDYVPYLASRLRSIPSFVRRRRQRRKSGESPPPSAGSDRIAEHHDRLFRDYRAKPFPGRLLILQSALHVRPYLRAPQADWRGLADGGVEVHLAPVDYREMLRQPYVATVAAWLRKARGSTEGS